MDKRKNENSIKPRTVLLLVLLSVLLCAAALFLFWLDEKGNPLPALRSSAQGGMMNTY